MIDSVELRWSPEDLTTLPRLARGQTEPISGPIRLSLEALADRHGREEGQITWKEYGGIRKGYGHWQVGAVDLMYAASGTLRLRCSLPKLLHGQNDQLLTEAHAHEALRRLVEVGSELTGLSLNLREAVPGRLDLYYQWEVDSVAKQLAWIEQGFAPARRKFDKTVSPRGGRTLYWGKGTKHVLRFYDKGAETREKREESPYGVDRLLRFEVQERRREHLGLIHEDGYRGVEIRERLQHQLDPLDDQLVHDLSGYLKREVHRDLPDRAQRLARLGLLYANEHPEVWPLLKQLESSGAYYKHRNQAKHAAVSVHPWRPEVPDDAFGQSPGLWADDLRAAA